MLPPLPLRAKIEPKGWMEEKISRIDEFFAKAVSSERPWWKSIVFSFVCRFFRLTLLFGRRFPYLFRPYLWVSAIGRLLIDRHIVKTKTETVRTLFFKRAFAAREQITKFNAFFALLNWLTVLFVVFEILPTVVEGVYAYGTYGTYKGVIVTQAYRNITDVNTFAVHGYHITKDGNKEPLYFSIGPNIWYWDLYPEFLFGQVAQYAKCDFITYGITVRVPTRLHFLSQGALYVLNPWIINMSCASPSIVPQ
jgi:hypothetical protein